MINLEDTYPGQVTAASASYPFGGPKNESSQGAFDGTPYEADMAGDIFGLQQALLESCGMEPSGDPDTATDSQQLQAIIQLATGHAGKYTMTNSGNNYTLTVLTGSQMPETVFDGMKVWAIVNASGTGAVTVAIAGLLAAKSVKKKRGTLALVQGDWNIGDLVRLTYIESLDVWDLENLILMTKDLAGADVPIGFNVSLQNIQNAVYAFVLSDAGKTIYHEESTARSWTIDPDATTNFPIGTIIAMENYGSGSITITRGSGVTLNLFNGVTPTNANRTLAAGGVCSIRKTAANTWRIIGNGGLS